LDSYSSYEHASRVANLSTILYDHLNLVADQVMLKFTDMAPDLYDKMHQTIIEFGDLDNPGGLQRAAKACQKMLIILAGRFSPKDGSGDASDNYFKGIESYISGRTQGTEREYLLSQLQDITDRIDSQLAFKSGIDEINPLFEGGRLLLGLIIFTCDVLMLDS